MIPGNEKGQITVFLSLLFLIMLGVALCVLEGIRSYMSVPLAEDAVIGAGEDILANYDRPLFERYHVFFLDPREKPYLKTDAEACLKNSVKENPLFGFAFRDIQVTGEEAATDKNGIYLQHQIREWMKYREAEEVDMNIRKLFQSAKNMKLLAEEQTEELISHSGESPDNDTEGEEVTQGEESAENEEEQRDTYGKEKVCWKNLKETLQMVMRSGVLLYAAGDASKISSSRVVAGELPSADRRESLSGESPGEGVLSFNSIGEWSRLIESGEYGQPDSCFLGKDRFLADYIFRCFSWYGQPEKEEKEENHALQCEVEYLIEGRQSDIDNVRCVANRILLWRFIVNYAYASKDAGIQARAESLSMGLTGFLGLPAAREAVRVLLTSALCYGESLLELHTLLNGGEIPVVKTVAVWNLHFENAPEYLRSKKEVKKGNCNVSYTDYLKMFLAVKNKDSRLYYRMMDIMQMNMALEEPGFQMKDCLFSYQWEVNITYTGNFASLPFVGQTNLWNMKLKRQVSY